MIRQILFVLQGSHSHAKSGNFDFMLMSPRSAIFNEAMFNHVTPREFNLHLISIKILLRNYQRLER